MSHQFLHILTAILYARNCGYGGLIFVNRRFSVEKYNFDYYPHFRIKIEDNEVKFKLEPDGTEVELELGFRVSVLRKAKMQLFHN